jgi:hypothetical protein
MKMRILDYKIKVVQTTVNQLKELPEKLGNETTMIEDVEGMLYQIEEFSDGRDREVSFNDFDGIVYLSGEPINDSALYDPESLIDWLEQNVVKKNT